MPPQRTDSLKKHVDFVAKDAEEQIATGIVMVPYAVDLQGDWEQPDTIQSFAEQFGNLYDADEADGGIMHAAWPSEWMGLEDNRVLESSQEIGGQEAPEGAWVQEWQFNDDELWELVEDGVLEGFSIGAINVDWNGPMDQDELPEEVSVPDEIDEDEPVWELTDGMVREVSTVDIPAVPDAQILDTKAAYEKRLSEHLGNRDGFIEEAIDRGHSEAEAERLWDVLSDAIDVEGAGDPGKQSFFARVGKAAFEALSGSDDGHTAAVPEAPDATADEQPDKDAAEGDTSDGDGGQEAADDMPDKDTNPDDDGGVDPIELAEQNAEQITELTAAVENLTETLTGPQPETTEIELDGETYEVPESEVKSALGVDEDAGVDVADAIESLKQDVDQQAARLDAINRQSGRSQQVDAAAEGDADEEAGGMEAIKEALS